ncbi:hypothetical protein PMKS-003990 [Pichia membranifaciens]|uniref:Uncharacterized protein n=1 Tax=Pichia membranifaciens TaxID=4926 RepID=A0A1Q2YLN7_9ASCO|nr:hypothetical protein PMKS-003990 [Pichia membranifaciens]
MLHNTMSISAPSLPDLPTSSTSAFTSTANSAMTSASTTPHLDSDGTLHSYKFERSEERTHQSDCEDEGQETDNTVIHYSNEEIASQHTLNEADFSAYAKGYRECKNFELEQDCDNTTKILDGHTRRNLSIEDIIDGYVCMLKQSQVDLKNEIHRAFEEFKFDIITDHLSPPIETIYHRTVSGPNRTISEHNGRQTYETYDRAEETVSIRLSETPLLGMSTCIEEFTTFVDLIKEEVIAGEVQIFDSKESSESNEDSNEDSLSDNIYGLGVVRERNEDERIRELSAVVGKVGYKLDLIELGMDSKEGIFTLKNDIDELLRCYNEVTSGKASKRNENTTTKDKELKKLRMSEILLDDFDVAAEKSRRSRRSSGIDLRLFSVVKTSEDVKADRCELVQSEERSSDTEFRKTLERLCLDRGAKVVSKTRHAEPEAQVAANAGMKSNIKNRTEETAFLEFKNELRKRLEEERL